MLVKTGGDGGRQERAKVQKRNTGKEIKAEKEHRWKERKRNMEGSQE